MNLTSLLFKVLSLSRDAKAVTHGPAAVGKRQVRKKAYKVTGRLLRKVLK